MNNEEKLLVKSLDATEHNAEAVFALAKTQREAADQQHAAAHRMENLGDALEQDAAIIRAELKAVKKKV